MSYQESNGTVTLTMSREDYQCVVFALGCALGCASRDGLSLTSWFELANRINAGNPDWTPYCSENRTGNPQASTDNHT